MGLGRSSIITDEHISKSAPILVVDDSSDDFEAVRRAFKKAGLTNNLEHMVSGEMALSYLREESNIKPCLILLDLNMPGMGGGKTLEIIKKDEKLKTIPVVVLTTSNHHKDIRSCYDAGANAYTLKPVDFDVLIQTINNIKNFWIDTIVLP